MTMRKMGKKSSKHDTNNKFQQKKENANTFTRLQVFNLKWRNGVGEGA